jgi:hypothetical protein
VLMVIRHFIRGSHAYSISATTPPVVARQRISGIAAACCRRNNVTDRAGHPAKSPLESSPAARLFSRVREMEPLADTPGRYKPPVSTCVTLQSRFRVAAMPPKKIARVRIHSETMPQTMSGLRGLKSDVSTV